MNQKMRSLEDIEVDLGLITSALQYLKNELSKLEREHLEAVEFIHAQNVDREFTRKRLARTYRGCKCNYVGGEFEVNPDCKLHGDATS